MCGRFVSTGSAAAIAHSFEARPGVADFGDRYNVAPTNLIYGVAAAADRVLRGYRWGLIPAWATDPAIGSKMINARVETITDKPSFRPLLSTHRCVLPMDGFYEWGPGPAEFTSRRPRKQPYFLSDAAGAPLAVAGLWTTRGTGVDQVVSTTIVTRPANGDLADVHTRMPALLSGNAIDAWLDPGLDDHELLLAVLHDTAVPRLSLRPVSTAVNDVRANGPALIEQVDIARPEPRLWED
jgi:putative SOS response-associated peptidase YedK